MAHTAIPLQMWPRIVTSKDREGKDHKESWWWNKAALHEKVKVKQTHFKKLITCREEERIRVREVYKKAKWEVKNTVVERGTRPMRRCTGRWITAEKVEMEYTKWQKPGSRGV